MLNYHVAPFFARLHKCCQALQAPVFDHRSHAAKKFIGEDSSDPCGQNMTGPRHAACMVSLCHFGRYSQVFPFSTVFARQCVTLNVFIQLSTVLRKPFCFVYCFSK